MGRTRPSSARRRWSWASTSAISTRSSRWMRLASVASFLQRLGRTGRRANTRANCTFFCLSSESLLQSVALLRLADAGWVEDVQPAAHAMHVLAHQVMALILQEGGISRHKLLPWVDCGVSVLEHSAGAAAGTHRHDGRARRSSTKLTVCFRSDSVARSSTAGRTSSSSTRCSPRRRSCACSTGRRTSATSRRSSSRCTTSSKGPLVFRLSGRAWEVGQIDWSQERAPRTPDGAWSRAELARASGRSLDARSARR